MKVAFRKWGNSLALRVPKVVAQEIGASDGKTSTRRGSAGEARPSTAAIADITTVRLAASFARWASRRFDSETPGESALRRWKHPHFVRRLAGA